MTEQLFYRSSAFRLRTLGLVASSWMMIGCGDTLENESEWTSENSQNAIEMEGNSLSEDAEDIPVINIEDMKWEEERKPAETGWNQDRKEKFSKIEKRQFKELEKKFDKEFAEREDNREKIAAKSQVLKTSQPSEGATVFMKQLERVDIIKSFDLDILDVGKIIIENKVCETESIESYKDYGIIRLTFKDKVRTRSKTVKIRAAEIQTKNDSIVVSAIKGNKFYYIREKSDKTGDDELKMTLAKGVIVATKLPAL